jgi:predicted nucleic acid-binding protein
VRTLPEPAAQAAVLDTDVASGSFRGRLPPRLAARLVGRQPILTFVTVELAQWTKLRHWGPRNIAVLEDWLADKPVIPGSRAIAALWGDLSAAAIQRGRSRPVNDTWIAACCLAFLAAQARQVFGSLGRALAAAVASPEQVAKITIYVVHHRPEYLPVIEAARAELFGDHKPADTLVGVETMAQPEYLIEVDAIAVIDG